MPTSETAGPLILVIEDDPMLRQYLRVTLESQNYRVGEAETGHAGLVAVGKTSPNLVLLDLGLPDMNGMNVVVQLREWTEVPILVLTGQLQEQDKVAALDAGADDYVTKPFGIEELLARVRVGLRQSQRTSKSEDDPIFTSGDLKVDCVRRLVFLNGEEVRLTPIEYRLLTTLIRRADQVVSHRQLLKEVWGPEYSRKVNYLRTYMKHLRDKLEEDAAHPKYLLSDQGVGYRLKKFE